MDEKKTLNGAGFYAVLGLLLVLVGLGGWAFLQTRPEPAPAPDPAPVTDVVRQPAVAPRDIMPEEPAPVREQAEELPTLPELAPTAGEAVIAIPDAEPEDAPGLIVYPVSGQVIAAFSTEELQYSPTLDDWRTHDGLDLAAQAGTNVLAACAGTVEAVEAHPLMGTTVTLSHRGGFTTQYANLQAKPPVRAGDEVSAGQIIGAVGQTAVAESGQPPHLHFAVERDGEAMDPETFLDP